MKNLKCQIRNLENITVSNEDYTAVEKELQLLGKKLLTEYVIKIGNIEVEPLWVEAYYSNISKKFSDPFIHGKEEQSKFCVLYFHHNTDDSRSGVDICLSLCDEDKNKSKYYLSESDKSCILFNKTFNATNTNDIVGYTTRIGLKATDSNPGTEKIKKSYISLRLAIAKNFDKSYPCEKRLPKLESLADNYLSTHESGNKENWYIDHFGYCPQKYKGK